VRSEAPGLAVFCPWLTSSSRGGDSVDSNVRYAAYASRFRTILVSAQRYVAYTSDIGESFRPIAHPKLVKAAYGVSWLYLVGDVSYEGYKAYTQNQKVLNPIAAMAKQPDSVAKTQAIANASARESGGAVQLYPGRVAAIDDYRAVMAQRAVFQSIASMGLPAFTIHSIVRYSGRALKDAKNKTIRTWGPIGVRPVLPPCT
jgi:mitochondrial fission process protein 1